MEKPTEIKNFLEFKVEDIKVFINKALQVKDRGLRLTLSGFLFFKSIHVDGIKFDL